MSNALQIHDAVAIKADDLEVGQLLHAGTSEQIPIDLQPKQLG